MADINITIDELLGMLGMANVKNEILDRRNREKDQIIANLQRQVSDSPPLDPDSPRLLPRPEQLVSTKKG